MLRLPTPMTIWKLNSESKCRFIIRHLKHLSIIYLLYTYTINSLQEMFEKRRRRRESHNAVERRRRDNINERIQGEKKENQFR
ncbi:hypothetical protein BCR43DRAFT_482578 [Syncephalastrum racemosum]|uniref:BHLH domain-containing protein n=1 Tax=Syncephalastrum racemosum TaxID=13706 RepID=A0A1X2HU15_SYNRA|nr:hypothetical protein BCR43DRAFT_482578 [Syncephalastrum racemosum]